MRSAETIRDSKSVMAWVKNVSDIVKLTAQTSARPASGGDTVALRPQQSRPTARRTVAPAASRRTENQRPARVKASEARMLESTCERERK